MKIILKPQRKAAPMTLEKQGEKLIINGEELDLSGIPNGATLEKRHLPDIGLFAGDIERDNAGELTIRLILPFGKNAPHETRFPEPITVTADGPVTLPVYGTPPEEEDDNPA